MTQEDSSPETDLNIEAYINYILNTIELCTHLEIEDGACIPALDRGSLKTFFRKKAIPKITKDIREMTLEQAARLLENHVVNLNDTTNGLPGKLIPNPLPKQRDSVRGTFADGIRALKGKLDGETSGKLP